MIQTGDPSGTGKGGESIWGKPFQDEIRATLKVRSVPCGRRGSPAVPHAGDRGHGE